MDIATFLLGCDSRRTMVEFRTFSLSENCISRLFPSSWLKGIAIKHTKDLLLFFSEPFDPRTWVSMVCPSLCYLSRNEPYLAAATRSPTLGRALGAGGRAA